MLQVDMRSLLFDRSAIIYPAIEFFLARLALGPTASFVPLIFLIAVINVQSQHIVHRSPLSQLPLSYAAVCLGSAWAHKSALSSATGTSTESFGAAFLLYTVSTLGALAPLYLRLVIVSRAHLSPWAELTIFSTLWATSWTIFSNIWPLGRLLTWSPASGDHPYHYLLSYLGPAGIDWLVAAWASVCSETFTRWLMGSGGDVGEIEVDGEGPPETRDQARPRHLSILTGLLLALAIPSFITFPLALRPEARDTTPFGVGCVLPHSPTPKVFTFDDYVAASKQVNAHARVLLWPEGAVTFTSAQDKEEKLERIRSGDGLQGPLYGIAFEEYTMADPSDPNSARLKRNGLALVHYKMEKGEEVFQYYKRNLVPVAESFQALPSVDPPSIFDYNLSSPHNTPKPDWSPHFPHTRPVPITSSICFDFASPSAFTSLESRPALILAPAKTWDTKVGLAMWEQAKTRADELGSMVLWCDGGVNGVSGIGGGGMQEIMQVGGGSWTREIGLQYPFDTERTVYARYGQVGVTIFLWLAVGGHWVASPLYAHGREAVMRAIGGFHPVLRALPFVSRFFGRRDERGERRPEQVGERQLLLV
ncbi:hypothetical protein CONPUDRAFT_79106 [Coniophora puteana RWD-64-598 SS2]|uniref:CN hydrolase domain-containing protein n=1 Tax=Coniophora puteana (strain RWD-64-598) TaxID=741705 RepID=A0A5M3N7R5_CONPW|nr:uncharacterized protein CONPUDRAFT_79106 [Coniophora puteana RWD-64-598 SS2]EIW86901.1 hypothetical protein CONPUDRAFT_79106 [Coniophora puteana RWD-64-598 SS2]